MEFDWEGLLSTWNREVLATPSIADRLPAAVVRSGWLGFAGATEEQILRLERQLGAALPASYRQFLRFSNGWLTPGSSIIRLYSAEEVEWYRARNQDAIDAWMKGVWSHGAAPEVPDEVYLVYGESQDSSNFRDAYLQMALQISEVRETDVYLLNPLTKFADGEWEAWFHAHWVAGAVRYRSFWDLMQAEHETFVRSRGRTDLR